MMEKLPMCRICLAEDVRMYVVVNKNLHELYEKLTDVPFVTEDSRPMLACFFCCTKLKQCWRFQRKCLEAEEMFAQMLNKACERNPLINTGHLKFLKKFSNSPIELISIVGGGQTESDAIKEELRDVSEELDDVIDPKEEPQTDELKLENVDKSYPDIKDLPVHHADSDSEYEIPLIDIKTEVEDEQESIGSPVSKKPKLDTRRSAIRNKISAKEKKHKNNLKSNRSIFKEPFTKIQHGVNTALGTSYRSISNEDEINCKISNETVGSDDIKKYGRVCVKEKHYECLICQRSFSKKCDLTRHIRTHTGEKPFKCDICLRGFSQKSNVVSHIRTHTGDKPFKCDICQRCFSEKFSLVNHIRTHTGEKPFKCDICQRSFSEKLSLKIHIRTHTGEKPFECGICQHRFIKKSDLTKHTRTHTGEKPFKCDICQRSFRRKPYLIIHMRTHTGGKPFKCDICQRSFSEKPSLLTHVRTHTGEKPFKCDICLRGFTQKGHLVCHTRFHTGEKTFKCDICQRGFTSKRDLVGHTVYHTREKPFKCDIMSA